MSRLETTTGSLEAYQESIIVFGDRKKNLRPASNEMLHNFILKRANEMLEYLSSDLSCGVSVLGGVPSEPSDWFNGIPCEILKPGQAWEKGTVTLRITADFISDSNSDNSKEMDGSPEKLSLDEIRNSIEPS